MKTIELRPEQKAIVRECLSRNVLVVAPMGAGKTLATLSAIAVRVYNKSVKNVLIVAPKRVAMNVWEQESKDCGMCLNIKFCKTSSDITSFLLDGYSHHICVCSVTRITDTPSNLWDMVVGDESTLWGNKTAIRSKEMRRVCKSSKYRILLSGTPIHGGYEKLFHQIFLLDGGKALGKSLTAFRDKYMRVKRQNTGAYTSYEINPHMEQQLIDDVRHLIFVVKSSVNLPPLLYKNMYVSLSDKRMKEYKQFEETAVLRFQEETGTNAYGDTKSLISFAASGRGIKLRQLASGVVYTDENRTEWSVTHFEKIEALKELREVFEGGILVMYQFKSELAELKKAFPSARMLNTPKDIEDWNNGLIDVALSHPASIGHGLNLQFGGHVIVWYSLTYDAELFAQANKRLHRPGQDETVTLAFLIAKGTIDERIINVLLNKEERAYNFLNM